MTGLQPRQLAAALLLSLPLIAAAEIPESMSYQGFLTDRFGSPISDSLEIEFSIYTVPTGGSPLWTDTQEVVLFQGLFSVELGSDENLFPADLFETPLFLGIKVGTDTEMVPRRPLTAVGFAFKSEDANTLQGETLASLRDEIQGFASVGPKLVANGATVGSIVELDEATVGGTSSLISDIPAWNFHVLTSTGYLARGTLSPGDAEQPGSSAITWTRLALVFDGPNCTGNPYLSVSALTEMAAGTGAVFASLDDDLRYVEANVAPTDVALASSQSTPFGCQAIGGVQSVLAAPSNDPAITGIPATIETADHDPMKSVNVPVGVLAAMSSVLVLTATASVAGADSFSESYGIRWDVTDAGGGTAMSETYILTDSTGQPSAIGESFSTNYTLAAGFEAPPDSDADLVKDFMDNCTHEKNTDQRDTNGDGIGNACDADLNDDCAVNFEDLGLMKAVFFIGDPDADLDGDGAVNFIDLGIMKSSFFAPPGPSGVPNGCQ